MNASWTVFRNPKRGKVNTYKPPSWLPCAAGGNAFAGGPRGPFGGSQITATAAANPDDPRSCEYRQALAALRIKRAAATRAGLATAQHAFREKKLLEALANHKAAAQTAGAARQHHLDREAAARLAAMGPVVDWELADW